MVRSMNRQEVTLAACFRDAGFHIGFTLWLQIQCYAEITATHKTQAGSSTDVRDSIQTWRLILGSDADSTTVLPSACESMPMLYWNKARQAGRTPTCATACAAVVIRGKVYRQASFKGVYLCCVGL